MLPPHIQQMAITQLVLASGRDIPEPRIAEIGAALLMFTSDGGVTAPGGFVFRYELQALEPPARPSAVIVDPTTVTRSGDIVMPTPQAARKKPLNKVEMFEVFYNSPRVGATPPGEDPDPRRHDAAALEEAQDCEHSRRCLSGRVGTRARYAHAAHPCSA